MLCQWEEVRSKKVWTKRILVSSPARIGFYQHCTTRLARLVTTCRSESRAWKIHWSFRMTAGRVSFKNNLVKFKLQLPITRSSVGTWCPGEDFTCSFVEYSSNQSSYNVILLSKDWGIMFAEREVVVSVPTPLGKGKQQWNIKDTVLSEPCNILLECNPEQKSEPAPAVRHGLSRLATKRKAPA